MSVARPAPAASVGLLAAAAAGGAVAVLLGVYGQVHDPTGDSIFTLFFSGTINLKAWFATLAFVLAVVQIVSALWMYGKLPVGGEAPDWVGPVHRLSGLGAFLVSLPVAYHCLWGLGFETDTGEARRFVHSVAGCFFYGVFTVKVLAVRSRRMPGWSLPVLGGTVFAVLAVLWATSSLWFFQNVGFPEI